MSNNNKQYIEKKAKDKLDIISAALFNSDAIMLRALCMVDKKPCTTQDTIGIDTRTAPPTMKYNPNFINAVSMDVLEHIVIAEGFKILLRHCTTRLYEPKNISALSSDVTVSDVHQPTTLYMNPEDIKMLDEFRPTPRKFDLEDNLYFEEYYRQLLDRHNETQQKIKEIWDSMSDEEKQNAINNAMNNQGQNGQGGQGQGQPQDQNDSQDERDDGKDQNGYKEYNPNNPSDAVKDYYDPNGTSNRDWGRNELLDAEVQHFINENKNSMKNWGKYTGNCMANIVAANTPKISYKEILRKFARSVLSVGTVNSRMKVNRRFDLHQPGNRRVYKTKVVFGIDTSGSMSDADLAECFAVVNSCCTHAEITYVLFDTKITQVETKLKKAKQEFKVTGRGGTDFQEIVDFTDNMDADGLIIATDGCAPCPNMPRKCKWKLLWLMTNKEYKPPSGAVGYVAHLDRYEGHY